MSSEEVTPPTNDQLVNEALKYRPSALGMIEPELRHPKPRRDIWEQWLSNRKAVLEWDAVRGWVCFVHEQSGHPEGPDYYFAIARETDAGIKIESRWVGYDKAHWFMGSNAHYMWFHKTIQLGKPVTLLVPPETENTQDKAIVYGMAEPRIRIFPADIVEFMKPGNDPEQILGAIDCFDEIFHRLAKQNSPKITTLLKVLGNSAEGVSSDNPHDIARFLIQLLKRDGINFSGLNTIVEHLSTESIVRFAAD